MASLLADELGADALVCLGYPFYAVGKPEKPRVEHLAGLKTPTLIVQGERDALGNREAVAGYALSPAIEVSWLVAADHDLKPLKASGFSHEQHLQAAAQRVASFGRHTLRAALSRKRSGPGNLTRRRTGAASQPRQGRSYNERANSEQLIAVLAQVGGVDLHLQLELAVSRYIERVARLEGFQLSLPGSLTINAPDTTCMISRLAVPNSYSPGAITPTVAGPSSPVKAID